MQELEQIIITKPTSSPLVQVVIAFAGGIAVARAGWFSETICWAGILCLSSIILATYRRFPQKTTLLLLPLFLLIGVLYTNPYLQLPTNHIHIYNQIDQKQEASLIGILKQIPKRNSHKTKLLIEVQQIQLASLNAFTPSTGLLQLTINGEPLGNLIPGQRLLVHATLSPPNTFKTPGVFNYKNFLASQSIWLTGWIQSPSQITQLNELQHPPLYERIRFVPEKIRNDINQFLENAINTKTIRGFYKAILIGDRTELSEVTLEKFKEAGCFHLLAISGMHLGLLGILIMASLSWLLKRSSWLILRFPVWKITAFISLLPLSLYALITGFQPPVARAMIMVTVFIAAILANRQWSILTNISIAAFLILIWRPTTLYSISFQLSFAAVCSIALLYPQIHPLLTKKIKPQNNLFINKLQRWTLTSLAISTIAMLGTAPFLLFYFNRISLLSPISTLLIAPLLCFWTLPIGLISLIFIPISPELAKYLLDLGSWGINGTNILINFLAKLPYTNIWTATPSIAELLCYFSLLIGLAALKYHRTAKLLTIFASLFLVTIPTTGIIKKQISRQTKVNFLDVGQGNSSLLELPNNYNILIDGGGPKTETFNVGKNIIAPFLWKKRITSLDDLIINHPHADHYNGLFFILNHFKPKTVWINGLDSQEPDYKKLTLLAQKLGLSVKNVEINTQFFKNDKAQLTNIADLHLNNQHLTNIAAQNSGSYINNQSLVLRLDCNNFSFLFPGDIEKISEEKLIAEKKNIDVDVLLAPHHGSRTSGSANFIKKVSPKYIVVSAGPFKPAFFPDKVRIREWNQKGINVLNTAKNGTTTFFVDDNNNLIVKPFI